MATKSIKKVSVPKKTGFGDKITSVVKNLMKNVSAKKAPVKSAAKEMVLKKKVKTYQQTLTGTPIYMSPELKQGLED